MHSIKYNQVRYSSYSLRLPKIFICPRMQALTEDLFPNGREALFKQYFRSGFGKLQPMDQMKPPKVTGFGRWSWGISSDVGPLWYSAAGGSARKHGHMARS